VHAIVRKSLSLLVLGGAVGLGGCLEIPSSLNPGFSAESAVAVEGIEGTWREAEGTTALGIRGAGEAVYEMTVFEKGEPSPDHQTYELRFARLGGELFWDLTVKEPGLALGMRRVHVPARVRLDAGVLEIAFLDPEALGRALDDGELELTHAVAHDDLVLTGPTEEVQAFLEAQGGNDALFGETSRFLEHGAPRR
jgi:hypothetical protein